MPLPTPNKDETKQDFISRCMGNPTMREDYSDRSQRFAICNKQWKGKPKKNLTMSDMLRVRELKRGQSVVRLEVAIKQVIKDQQIVIGEVYSPNIIDTHNDMMEAEDVELLAHRFIELSLNNMIDIMHNNKLVFASAVESWINRTDPIYNLGAWVMATKIYDPDVWEQAKNGTLAGYSIEMLVKRIPALVTIEVIPHVFGVTEKYDGHDHAFYASVDEEGRVTGGETSKDDGHTHTIRFATATEKTDDHRHRFFLP